MYCAAKFAVEGYTESMATYLSPAFNIHFTAIEPGGIRTEFANNVLEQFQSTGGMRDDAYRPLLEKYIAGAGERSRPEAMYQTPEEVAQVIAGCLADANPPIRLRTSPWAEQLCELKTAADPTGKKLQQLVIDQFM